MAEYIKRAAALESLCTGCEYVPIDKKENCPYRFTGCQEYANIFAIPSADVVEVVRCGECKHRTSGNPNCVGRNKNWHCPCGEKRDDNG